MLAAIAHLCLAQWHPQSKEAAAETARWIVHESTWGYLTSLKDNKPIAEVASFSDGAMDNSSGRIFFYLMGVTEKVAALTISEAGFNGTCGFAGTVVDPEDPRCGKLTLTGTISKSTGGDVATGKDALFARHPQMAHWPASHSFQVCELNIQDIWMIDSYGGGSNVAPAEFLKVKPRNNRPKSSRQLLATRHPATPGDVPPPWNQTAARARWLVSHATWTSVGTVDVRLEGSPWGNVRSIADGVGTASTGLPYFYLPSPDPTAIDVKADAHITLSFSEAALQERAGAAGTKACGGMDAEDPTCARLHLSGTAVPLTSNETINKAKAAFKVKHPLAPWLAAGGAHTGGSYYTINLESLALLDYYGGYAKLSVEDYLAYTPSAAIDEQAGSTAGELKESFCEKVAENSGCCPACGYSWKADEGKCVTSEPATTLYCKLLLEPTHSGCCVFCGHKWSPSEGKCVDK
jgi:hypothetical protein